MRILLTIALILWPIHQNVRIPGPGGSPPAGGGTNMALICSVGASNDASGTVLTTGNANCTGANTFWVAYEEGANASVTITDSVGCTYNTPTNFTVSNGGVLWQFVAASCTGNAAHNFTGTGNAAETFRRIMAVGFSNGNASPVDGTGQVNSGSASPATTAAITPAAGGGVIVMAASNNDGLTCVFSANNSFTLLFGTNGNLGGTVTLDTDAQYILNQTASTTPSMGMTATGGAWRAVAVSLKK